LGDVDLAVLVPSRGRPHNIERLLDAMDATCRGDTKLVVGVDHDDPTLREYELTCGTRCDLRIRTNLHRRLVGWLNNLSAFYRLEYPYLGHIGDDNVPRTVGWDVRVMESLERNLFCFGDDLDPGREPGSLSLTIFMRSQVVKTLGYMGPPQIQHMYVDPVWFAWGSRTSIEFLPDVVLEHMHYKVGKAGEDESYTASTALIPSDCANYNAYCDDGLNTDIEKLGGEPFSDEELAEFNHRLNIPRVWGQPA
jgi:hypothetical protein